MKRLFSVFLICLSILCVYAKPKPVPAWVENPQSVYPDDKYLTAMGTGKKSDEARTDATAQLAYYFKTTVEANLTTTMQSVSTGDFIEETSVVTDAVSVQSQVEFFALSYTEPFHLKKEKKWYCLVYMDRETAWGQYKPEVDLKKNAFENLYQNLLREDDPVTKMKMCRTVWKSGADFLQALEFGRLINPSADREYKSERDHIARIPALFEEVKTGCRIYLSVEGDYNRMISSCLSDVFGEAGFQVVKGESEANYRAEVFIENNMEGNEPLAIMPALDFKLVGKNGKTVFSCEVLAEEKSVAYSLENAQKKAYPKLCSELDKAVREGLAEFYR